MKYFAIILSLSTLQFFPGEYSQSLAIKNISMQDALQRFEVRILPPTQTTLAHVLNRTHVKLLYDLERKHILLQAHNEQNLYLIHDLIQQYIDI